MRLIFALALFFLCFKAYGEVINIDNQTLQQLVDKQTVLVDVRRPDEWKQTGVVPGSHKLTFFDQNGNYDARKWLDELNKVVDKDSPVVLICHHGVRSKVVANWLSKGLGYSTVYNVEKGIDSWLRAGLKTGTQ